VEHDDLERLAAERLGFGQPGDDAAATGDKTLSARLVAEQGLLERAGAAPV
jgi:hypothetical protein